MVSAVSQFVHVSAGWELGSRNDVVGMVGVDGCHLSQAGETVGRNGMGKWVGDGFDSPLDANGDCGREIGRVGITFWCDLDGDYL